MHHLRVPARAGALLAVACFLVSASPASAALDEVDTQKLRKAVTVNGILGHERALQSIANLNGGTRASGTPGYDASAAYVKRKLQAAGYKVTEQEFEFPFFEETAPAVFERTSPTPRTYVNPDEFVTMEYSGSGDTTAAVQAVDVQVPPPAQPGSTSGCEAADFAGFTAGNIALIQRGTCDFAVKAANAEAAGASAVIIFNEGQPGRQETLNGTLGGPAATIPVLGTSFAVGEELVGLGASQVHIATSTLSETRHTKNVLADSEGGDAAQTVVVGAHLDSVPEGPGINDNGSGTATDLEVAVQLAKLDVTPRRRLRFAFWGAEESGLLGSQHYVDTRGDELSSIYANLNFDMVGSPNYVRFVYDGDGSATPAAGPPGSAQIEALFNDYFAGRGLATDPTAFDGRSDYGPFIATGVPAGGLFTGAEGVKTPEQAAVYGGTAGVAYDPNYHAAGDTTNNLNTKALNEMSDAVAHATQTLARSRSGFFEDGSRQTTRKVKLRTYRGPNAVR